MHSGKIIKKLRTEKGMTQDQLAEALGVNKSSIQKYESGSVQNLKLQTIRELCHIFGVPLWLIIFPELLYSDLDDTNLTEAFGGPLVSQFAKEIMLLNNEGKQKVLTYIDDLHASGKYSL